MRAEPTPAALEAVFRHIQAERMRDVPLLNPALEVAAVGFRDWEDYRLGVLVTPWFMSLVLLPGREDEWRGLQVGEKRVYAFPSGAYEFLLGEQADIGRYLSCSLYSPVLEFEDQAAAVATAEAVMRELFSAANLPRPAPGRSLNPPLAAGLHDDTARCAAQSEDAPEAPCLTERKLDRRAFLRGAFQPRRG